MRSELWSNVQVKGAAFTESVGEVENQKINQIRIEIIKQRLKERRQQDEGN